MRGRKTLPSAIKELRGSRSHKKSPINPIDPPGSLGNPYSWLSKSERALWRLVARDLPAGLLRACDRPGFAAYVGILATIRRYHDQIEAGGMAPDDVLAVERLLINLRAAQLRAEIEFGVSPCARARVAIAAPRSPVEDEFNSFIARKAT